MTGETVFARWSRLKQAARRPSSTEEAVADPSAPPADENVTLPVAEPAPAEAAEDGPPEPLPSLDELTAESDLTAFLRREVPEFLKNAALRKMWSIDPAIRDHVGLSECAWDFNSPGGVPGFGPIGETRSLPSFLSRLPEAEMPSALAMPSSERAALRHQAGGEAGSAATPSSVEEPRATEPESALQAAPPTSGGTSDDRAIIDRASGDETKPAATATS